MSVEVWKKALLTLCCLSCTIGIVACESIQQPTPTPDIEATVQTAVRTAVPAAASAPTPDIEGTVEAKVQAALAASFSLGPSAATAKPSSSVEALRTHAPNALRAHRKPGN